MSNLRKQVILQIRLQQRGHVQAQSHCAATVNSMDRQAHQSKPLMRSAATAAAGETQLSPYPVAGRRFAWSTARIALP